MKSIPIDRFCSELIIEELIRCGVRYFCIAPGSRSTPLTLAVAHHSQTKSYTHFDERGLAFFSLGQAKALENPVVIMTTSGTAVANLLPAVIEAYQSFIPLILLTADRPPELHNSGANQTIGQSQIFGKFIRWSCQLSCSDPPVPPQSILTTIDQLVYRATQTPAGPVHMNCMFREPFFQKKDPFSLHGKKSSLTQWKRSKQPYTTYSPSLPALDQSQIKSISLRLNQIKEGLLVVGELYNEQAIGSLKKLSEHLGWPLFPDVLSPLRWDRSGSNSPIIFMIDQILNSHDFSKKLKPEGILYFGGPLVSKQLQTYMKTASFFIQVNSHPDRQDPLHAVSHRVQSEIHKFCSDLLPHLNPHSINPWTRQWLKFNSQIFQTLSTLIKKTKALNEAKICWTLSSLIPPDHILFLGNSLPIREMGLYGQPGIKNILIYGNRGASGIDGLIATATGIQHGLNKPLTLLLGDLSLLHDLNSLALLRQAKKPFVIIVLNNNGGGIFSFLPIAQDQNRQNTFEKFFVMPHNLNFSQAAALFGLSYYASHSIAEFTRHYQKALNDPSPSLIEVETDRKGNVLFQKHIDQELSRIT